MGHAAVPKYVSDVDQDYLDCPPGHRFSLYFRIWNSQWGLDKDEAKTLALREVLRLPQSAKDLMQALGTRQQAMALALPAAQCCFIDAKATAPFATGLGLEHPIENGFAFLSPYGLPYLAGSGVKGVLRRAAEELEIAAPLIAALFGAEDAKDAESSHRGALSCWDVLPQFEAMTVEIMTPHQSGYYLGDESPHEAGQPTPISFLALPATATFRFVLCFEPSLVPDAERVALRDWQALVMRVATHAFDWLGFGAKTAMGYGAMAEDESARQQREQQAAEAHTRAEAAERELRRADMSPEQIEAEEAALWLAELKELLTVFDAKRYQKGGDFDQKRNGYLSNAGRLQSEDVKLQAAELLRKSYKLTDWPSNKEKKLAVKEALTRLDGKV